MAAAPAQGLTADDNDGPLDDPDSDGFANLHEFILGGHPMVSSSNILPTLSKSEGAAWTFEYERSVLSRPPATSQIVEYGSDLIGWAAVPIHLNSTGAVTITPGDPTDHVSIELPDLGTNGFARLKVNE